MTDAFVSVEAGRVLRGLLQHFAWQVRRGSGSFLLMDFGAPSVQASRPRKSKAEVLGAKDRVVRSVTIRGEYHLWLYQCAWVGEVDGRTLQSDTLTDEQARELARVLDGQLLQRLEARPDGTSLFEFDLGVTLRTSPLDATEDQWMVFAEREQEVVTLRGDGCMSVGLSAAPEGTVSKWLALSKTLIFTGVAPDAPQT